MHMCLVCSGGSRVEVENGVLCCAAILLDLLKHTYSCLQKCDL